MAHAVDGGQGVIQPLALILGEVFLRHLSRRVGGVVRQVAEKRLVAVALHEGDRLVGQDVGDIPFRPLRLCAAHELRIEVVVDVPTVEAEKLVEALAEGVVRELGAVVPFAETPGAVAGRPERLRDRHLRVAHDFLVVGDTGDAGAQRVTPGEQACARGRAKRADLKLFEAQALARETIEVGGFEQWVPM